MSYTGVGAMTLVLSAPCSYQLSSSEAQEDLILGFFSPSTDVTQPLVCNLLETGRNLRINWVLRQV